MATTGHCSIPVLTQLSNSRSPFNLYGNSRSPFHLYGNSRSPFHLYGNSRSPFHLYGNSRPPFQPHFYTTWQQPTIVPHLFQQNVATTHYHSTHLSQYGNNTLLMPSPTSRQCGTAHYHPTPIHMKQKQCMPPGSPPPPPEYKLCF